MLILIYILIGILLALAIFLNIKTKKSPNVIRTFLAIGFLYLIVYYTDDIFIDYVFFLGKYMDNDLLPHVLEFFVIVLAYLVLSLSVYFESLFKKSVDIKTEFVAITVLIIGTLSLFLNKYDLLFYLLIILGFELLLTRITIKKVTTKKFFWLSILYSLPIFFLVIFVISQAHFFVIISSYTLIEVRLLTVSVEYLLMALIMNFLLLTIYYLPYDKANLLGKIKMPKIRIK